MGDAGAFQSLAIQVGSFERVACAAGGDVEPAAVRQAECVLRQQREVEQIVVGAGIGIEPHHVERQPRGHGPRVVVARQTVGTVGVVVTHNLMDALRAEVGSVNPVIEAGREKRRFVLHVVVAFLEEEVEALAELLLAPTGTDESRHVVRNGERIFLTGGLVEERGPPRQIPWCHLGDGGIGNRGMEHLGMAPRHTVEPTPLGILRQNKTAHAIPLVVLAPEVAPRTRLLQILPSECLLPQAARHLRNAPVAEGIFHGSVAGAVDAIGDVAQAVVLRESATAVLLVVSTRVYCGILEHGLEGQLIVDATQLLRKGIGNDHLGIRTSLRATVAVAAAGIGHVVLACVYI